MPFLAATVSSGVVGQVVQVAGAVCVLAGFAGAQIGVLSTQSAIYLVLNLVGSVVLAWLAAVDQQYGFLLLEAVWALVSAWALVRLTRGKGPVSAH